MSRHVNSISNRLSLRPPQRQSLEALHRVMETAEPHKNVDTQKALEIIQSEYPTVTDFERSFPSLCFALATGVGKTRLMGAFITYLHLEHGIRNFFILAPRTTVYTKLVTDFTPNTPKYVFQGISEFAVKSPTLVTGDNFEQKPQVMSLFETDDVVINIFNIAKFNARSKELRKAWRLSEFLGQSYFDYLASLDDLVLIMDEAHSYRAETSMQSIEDLKPLLGLELTATPQIETGKNAGRFKNIIVDYPLAHAMRDGFVKEPAVATRANFSAAGMDNTALEMMKLEDGVRLHESTKTDLSVYATNHRVPPVKPFMLVIAQDTDHANAIVSLIESEKFFDGYYKGRVIQVHSGQSGAEKDENVERLLAVERPDEPTEIVVHVNMLKEGWDVTNLYTIVPLRAANSRTLVEQSIGRGLRLPYGKRTGVAPVDRLTIVAHDHFQQIVDEAKKGGYTFNVVHIGEDISGMPKKTFTIAPVLETILGVDQPLSTSPADSSSGMATSPLGNTAALPRYSAPEERQIARAALEAIRDITQTPNAVRSEEDLNTEDIQQKIVEAVAEKLKTTQLEMYPTVIPDTQANIIKEVTNTWITHTIAIPHVQVDFKGPVKWGFHKFDLDMSSLNLKPVSREIVVQNLVDQSRQVIGSKERGLHESRLEDYVVRGLIDFDDICYDDHADLLYHLAEQVVTHFTKQFSKEDEVRNILLHYQQQISSSIHSQMQHNAYEEDVEYEVIVSRGYSQVNAQAFAMDAAEKIRHFDTPIDNKSDIRKMIFGGFEKCLYPQQKFDSDPERRFAAILEKDPTVLKWFKPGKNVFKIAYAPNHDYEPDFVVETSTEKLMCEPKRADQLKDETVIAKANAAAKWCTHASDHEQKHNGKPWRYLLIPHDVIGDNATVEGLIGKYTHTTGDK
ncbi:MAG: DEAD/DEAH box helicase family protein [Deltaproteobacteria bacterium]|nr:DEAD/DEAH box helicase family protein [Deltaproteobacteria bacterium]MBN2673660.1 DEAD/DEAH box helicase family protein [Deltaproteobacteria bacterium]